MSSAPSDESTRPTSVACAHCGLPAPPPKAPAEPSFCCHGCKGAYELIRGWGLEEYYQLRDADGELAVDASEISFADFDDAALLGRSAPMPVSNIQSVRDQRDQRFRSKLSVSGLHCVACIWLIERASERVDGWHSTTVNMHTRTIEVVFDPNVIRLSAIGMYLYRLGYRISVWQPDQDKDPDAKENTKMLIGIAVSGFCAANAMWIAVALYAGEHSGIEDEHAWFLRVAGVVLGSLAVIFPGRVFYRSAWASWKTRTPHMDLPVAVGLTAGLLGSIHGLFDLQNQVYFDSIAALVFFLLVGRWIQMRQQRRAGEAVAELVRIAPHVATRINQDGSEDRVPVDSIAIGDLVRIDPGNSIPIDGEITDGTSAVDRSLMTGESRPVEVGQGDLVEAGTENLQGSLTVRATAAPNDTRFAELTRAVAKAAQSRTPIVQLANRIGGWFVMVVLSLAVITAFIWWQRDPSQVVGHVVSLLIVACPCALALATPLAIAVSIGRLAKRGILVRDGDCLERMHHTGTILFDKTGTLTEGKMRVSRWVGDDSSLAASAAIEANVNHPIAKAVTHFAADKSVDRAEAEDVRQDVGRGVSGVVNGARYTIGRVDIATLDRNRQLSMVSGRSIDVVDSSRDWHAIAEEIADDGASPLQVLRDDEVVALFGVTDPLRTSAFEVTRFFRQQGWELGIISGDNQRTVNRVAAALELDEHCSQGELLPEEKLQAIENHKSGGRAKTVVMVGDGVNDAAALAASDVGIAIGGGAAASLHAAPVLIADGRLSRITLLAEAAEQTRKSIQRNFAVSISYNAFAVVLAMTGMITPLIAALLMPISSVSVLALTMSHKTLPDSRSEKGS